MSHANSILQRFVIVTAGLSLLFYAIACNAGPSGSYFAVIVKDLDASVDWYANVFDVDRGELLTDGDKYKIVNLARPGLFIELLELRAAVARPEHYLEGPFKLGLLVDDLDAFVRRLPESIPPLDVIEDERNNLRFVQLRDPDGNIVQVMETLSSSDNQPAENTPG